MPKFIYLSIAILAFTLLFVGISACLRMRKTDKSLNKEYKNAVYKPSQHQYIVCNRTMNYAEVGHDSLPVVLFIHGSPGSWESFEGFFKDSLLLSKAKVISVDRPGFGYSTYGKAEPSLEIQAACILPLLEKYARTNQRIILVGHSLGGPLIARIAMDYPKHIKALIFVAASVDPELEPHGWYRKPMKFVDFLLPGSIRSSNREIISLKSELQRMLPLWHSILQPCVVIQGDKDNLVSPNNVQFLQKHLVNTSLEVVMIKDMNHFIPWKAPQKIRDAIFKMIDK